VSVKLAVMGGGPAGLSAAIKGKELGFEITLFEANRIGEKISCAEGYFDLYNVAPPPQAGIRFQIEQVNIRGNNDTYSIPVGHLHLWMINRQEWQQSLAKKAISVGVQVKEQKRITPKDLLHLKNHYDYIIDSCGALSPTASLYNFRHIY
jgi:flavin-dependent dehydrogenase